MLFHHLLTHDGDLRELCSVVRSCSRIGRCWIGIWRRCKTSWIAMTSCGRRSCGKGLRSPAQVVWRHAPLHVTEVELSNT